jgi:HEAT repeat protein
MKINISGLLTLLIIIQLSTGCSRGADDIVHGETEVTLSRAAQPDSARVRNGWIFDGENPWLSSVNYFGRSVALVNLLILVIAGSILTMLSLLVFILLNRRRMERRAKLYQYLLESYQGLIIEHLYGEADAGKFREIASNRYRRQVLIDQMKDVAVNLKGESWLRLRELYLELGLNADSIRKAYSKHWHIRIKGFRELAFMNIPDANDVIYNALNSGNEILRMEAQIALVRLSDYDPFEFLDHLRQPFSLWEQISLHELIVQHSLEVPLFSKWLTSENHTVVMFALRMIREFKQYEAEGDVIKVMSHDSPEVRGLAIEVAGDLNMESTREVMKRMYKHEEYKNSLEILKSMGKMPDVSMLNFLKLVLDKEDDVQLQIEATKAIENIGEEGVKALVKLMKSEYKNYNIIIRHVLDRRIY